MSNLNKTIKDNIKSVFFYISIGFGSLLSLLSAYSSINSYFDEMPEQEVMSYNMLVPVSSVYTFWIGDKNQNIFSIVLFWLIPFLSVLPILTYYTKAKHTANTRFCLTDYITAFITAGMAISFPVLLNFSCVLLFVPAVKPDSVYDIYYGIFSYSVFSDIFYSHPAVYEMIYVACLFVIGGLCGGVAYTLLKIFRNKIFGIFIVPSIILLLQLDYQYTGIMNTNISLISFCYSTVDFFENIKTVTIEALLMLLFSIGNIVCNNMKSEKKSEEI